MRSNHVRTLRYAHKLYRCRSSLARNSVLQPRSLENGITPRTVLRSTLPNSVRGGPHLTMLHSRYSGRGDSAHGARRTANGVPRLPGHKADSRPPR